MLTSRENVYILQLVTEVGTSLYPKDQKKKKKKKKTFIRAHFLLNLHMTMFYGIFVGQCAMQYVSW